MKTPADTPLWVSEAEVVATLDIAAAVHALERGLLAEAAGRAHNMIKTHVEWDGSTLHAIGAIFPELGICGTKTWSHTPNGATPLLVLFDTRDGSLKAIIEAFALGQMRTAAASGVATRWLAAVGADVLAMIGTGKQALTQVAAVMAVRPLREVRVFGRDKGRRDEFIQRLGSEFQVTITAADSVEDALRGASIISVATRATEPIITAAMVMPGSHVNSVGAIVPSRAEIAPDVLSRCTQIVTDSVPQAQNLSREMMEFFGPDHENWHSVRALAEIVAGRRTRTASDDITLFKALGVGISDLALGIEIYQSALKNGWGRPLSAPERVRPRLSGKVEAPS